MPYLCLSSDVAPGHYLQVDAFGDNLLVWRDGAGKLGLDRNACPHRGFPMGRGAGALPLRCRYHGLPFLQRRELPVVESGGMIWSDAAPELGPVEAFVVHEASRGVEYQREVHRVAAGWSLWIQNTMDARHVKYVHPKFSEILEEGAVPYATRIGDDRTVSSYRVPVRMELATRWRKRFGAIVSADFFHVTVYPHLSVTSFLGLLYSVETAEPLERGESLVTTRYFTAAGVTVPASMLRASAEANRQILLEDRAVCEEWGRGGEFSQAAGVTLSDEERIEAFREKLKEDFWYPKLINE